MLHAIIHKKRPSSYAKTVFGCIVLVELLLAKCSVSRSNCRLIISILYIRCKWLFVMTYLCT